MGDGTAQPDVGTSKPSLFSWLPDEATSALLGVVSDGVLITDADGTILQANTAFAELCAREVWELEGAPVALLVDSADDPVATITAMLANEPEWTGRVQLRRSDGRLVECDAWVRQFADESGSWWVSVQHEVGVRRRYGESTIDETEARIHDLVNSLASLRGYVQLLDRVTGADAEDVRARLVSLTRSTTERLEDLLAELRGE